jgi:hypothetical protein
MATRSVTSENLPARKFTGNSVGFDTQGAAESARYALNGIEAIASIIQDNVDGEHAGQWSEGFIWHLIQGQQALAAFSRQQVDLLQHELWFTHALLGDYGPEARARAQRELAENSDERRAA